MDLRFLIDIEVPQHGGGSVHHRRVLDSDATIDIARFAEEVLRLDRRPKVAVASEPGGTGWVGDGTHGYALPFTVTPVLAINGRLFKVEEISA